MKRTLLIFAAAAILAIVFAAPAPAQVVREEGVKTIAGVLGQMDDSYDDYTFLSSGNDILTVSVDSQVYDKRGGDHQEGETGAAEEGGCEGGGEEGGGCEGEEGGGCDDGDMGPGGLCLQLLDSNGTVIQAAGRPRLPGWQRDPRMIAIIPVTDSQKTYTVRIALADEACGDLRYPVATGTTIRPYLLNVSLRKVAPEGASGPAVAASKNRF